MNDSQLQLGFSAGPAVLSVSDLTAEIRGLIEGRYPDVWIRGEVSNCRRAASGHYYFTLKDDTAQLRCVCFRQQARYLTVAPADGLAVQARGRIGVYEARGEYQLYVEHIEHEGIGALQAAFERLKKKLAAEGLFDEDRKRPLPPYPDSIGIVTSPSGAAVADMVRVLVRRFPGIQIQIFPAKVQGERAAEQVAAGIRHFSESANVDVIIAGRGGGSLEDLAAFNEEIVARAIAESAIPVVSAVGHQTDFTIADFTADVRAPTPSAAAEIVVRAAVDVLETIESHEARLRQMIRFRLSDLARHVAECGIERGQSVLRRKLNDGAQRIDEADYRLRAAITARLRQRDAAITAHERALARLDLRVRLARRRSRLEQLQTELIPLMRLRLQRASARLSRPQTKLEELSPVAILGRGYSIVQKAGGEIVRAAGQVEKDEKLQIRVADGEIRANVE